MSTNLDAQERASYEHRKFLLQLSDELSKTELRYIVLHEDLPKELLDGENKSPDPLHVMMHLEMQDKTTPEELTRILSDINREDLVKLVAKYKSKKDQLTSKNFGRSASKLEDTLTITVKSSDILAEHVELLLKHSTRKGNKRVEELVSEAKANIDRKLRYAYGLLGTQNQTEHCNTSSRGSSLESNLTLKASPGHQRPQINDSELKKAFEKLKPLSVATQRGERVIPQPCVANSSTKFNMNKNEDDIYSLPGPVKTIVLPTHTSDTDSENGSGKALLVRGSSKTAKSGPTVKPKPFKGKYPPTVRCTTVRYTTGKSADNISSTDDYSYSTYSYTGDSGFSDSRAFLKELSPTSPQHTPVQTKHALDLDTSYTPLITADLQPVAYYKSLYRESIPDIDTTYLPWDREASDWSRVVHAIDTGTDQAEYWHGSKFVPHQDLKQDLQKGGIEGIFHDTYTNTDKKNDHIFNVLPSVSVYYEHSSNVTSVPFLSQVEILICDSFGGEYHTSDHGITLRIPEGAIPSDQIAHLEVAVALYGPFQFPEGSCPISPILWLCIQENFRLKKPIDIVLPHFLTNLNEMDIEYLGVRFAKADHEQYIIDTSGKKFYIFNPLETAFITYKERRQNYGILSIKHCCFFCITSNNPISPDFALKAGYYLWPIEKPLAYSSLPRARDTLLFCATFCLPTCRQALKSQYTDKEGYFIGKPNLFTFKDPGNGLEPCLLINIEDDLEGCLMAAKPKNKQIKASQVYFWDEKRDKLELLHADKVYPPSVTLTLEMLESHPINLFVKFNGTTADDMDMEIMLPLASTGSARSRSSSPAFVSQWISTDKPKISTLLKELYTKAASKWEDIGLVLEIEPETLESLKTAENSTPQSRLREMLKIWLKKVNPPPSWSAIADALQYLGNEELAHYLRLKYLKQ